MIKLFLILLFLGLASSCGFQTQQNSTSVGSVGLISTNPDLTLGCVEVPGGFLSGGADYSARDCVEAPLKTIRYRVYYGANSAADILLKSLPSESSFASETDSLSLPGIAGDYSSLNVTNWETFLGRTLSYNDEICVTSVTAPCGQGVEAVESDRACFKWFGKEVFSFTGADQAGVRPNPLPSRVYVKSWGAGGGGGLLGANTDNRAAGGLGGYSSFKGDASSDYIVVVGEGGGKESTVAPYGGGGAGGLGGTTNGGAGGGMSGLFSNSVLQANALMVAGGGGGSGGVSVGTSYGNGGSGGALSADPGTFSTFLISPLAGGGGTQLTGGIAGTPGTGVTAGAALQGGIGHSGGVQGAGGGGGGYFGGGGGGNGNLSTTEAGGGGGSGFTGGSSSCDLVESLPTTITANLALQLPANSVDVDYDGVAGSAGSSDNLGVGGQGGNGLVVIYWIP